MKFTSLSVLIIVLGCQPSKTNLTSLTEMFSRGKWVDLSYNFSKETIYWPNNPEGFQLDTQFNGTTSGGYYYASNAFCSPEHGGTHIDAPVHFAKGKWAVDQIPLENLIGEAVVIDVSEKAKSNADYQASVTDIEAWEKKYGEIPANTFV